MPTDLFETAASFKRALQASRLCMWHFNFLTGHMYLSEAWSERLGGPSVATLTNGTELLARIPKPDLAEMKRQIIAVVKGEEARFVCEHRVIHDDGSVMWNLAEGEVSERSADGRATALVGTNRDITARRNRDDLLNIALTHMAQGLMQYDENKVLVAFNDRIQQFLNLPPHILKVGVSIHDLIAYQTARGDFAQGVAWADDAQQTSIERANFGFSSEKTRYLRSDRQGMTLQIETTPVESGGWVRTITDVTDVAIERQRRSESEAIATASNQLAVEQANRLEIILAHSSNGMILIDRDRRVIAYNPRALELLNLPADFMRANPTQRELFDFRYQRGDFGAESSSEQVWLATESSHEPAGDSLPAVQRTQCGLALEVRTVALAAGGWVRTYTDITAYVNAEQARAKSEAQLRALFAAMRDRIWMKDTQGVYRACNPAFESHYGAKTADILGKRDIDFVSQELAQEFLDLDAKAMRDGVASIAEYTMRDLGTGATGLYEIIKQVVVDTDGNPMGVLGIARNIEARKKAELALKLSTDLLATQTAKLEVILANTTHGVLLVDKLGHITGFNARVLDLLDLPDELLRSVPSQERLLAFQFDRGDLGPELSYEQAFEKYMGNTGFGSAPSSYLRKTKEKRVLEVRTVPIPAGGWVRTYSDVTSFVEAQETIQSTTQLLNSVLDAATEVAIMAAGIDRVITLFNKGAERLLGYTSAEVVGTHTKELFRDPDELAQTQTAMSAQLGQGISYGDITVHPAVLGKPRNWSYLRKDGTRVPVSVTITERRDASGTLLGYLAMARDISEQLAHETRLQQARENAEEATKAKSAFLATMSHEIRTPMNGVIGMTSLLLETPLTEEQQEFTEVIRASGESLMVIINDVLDFSKIESGKMLMEQAAFSVQDCIESCIELLTLKAQEKRLDLVYLIEDDVPQWIFGDLTRVRQVLVNIVSNALKFTESGDVLISVRRVQYEHTNPIVLEFAVKDTGIGITETQMQHLFLPFSQLDSSTTRKYGGTGLGLAISKRLVEWMGGEIHATSAPEGGTTFSFTILTQAAETPVQQRPKGPSLLEGRRALVVDDNSTNLRILGVQLSRWGMRYEAFQSPLRAREHLRNDAEFDVILTDMHMPGMDGLAFAVAAKALTVDTPLVLLTSLNMRQSAETHLFAAVLAKPCRQSNLYDALVDAVYAKPKATRAPELSASRFDVSLGARLPLRVLLAEDNEINQRLALRMLSSFGYQADVAANGLEVLDACRRQHYDLIFMDVQMPEMDGLEATRRIVADWPLGQRPRVVAMSANAMAEDLELAKTAGVDGYITKPVALSALKDALTQWGQERNGR